MNFPTLGVSERLKGDKSGTQVHDLSYKWLGGGTGRHAGLKIL